MNNSENQIYQEWWVYVQITLPKVVSAPNNARMFSLSSMSLRLRWPFIKLVRFCWFEWNTTNSNMLVSVLFIISRMTLQYTNILKEAKNKHNNQALTLIYHVSCRSTSQPSNLNDLPGPPLSPGWWCAHMLMTVSLPKATWGHSHPLKPSHWRLCSKYGLLSANLPLGTNNFPDNKTPRLTHIHHNIVMIHVESKNTMIFNLNANAQLNLSLSLPLEPFMILQCIILSNVSKGALFTKIPIEFSRDHIHSE